MTLPFKEESEAQTLRPLCGAGVFPNVAAPAQCKSGDSPFSRLSTPTLILSAYGHSDKSAAVITVSDPCPVENRGPRLPGDFFRYSLVDAQLDVAQAFD
jgi:hypothetical protein